MECYIRVKDHVDVSWASWFAPLQIRHERSGTTLLWGALPDQAALYRVLLKIDRLGLTLLALETNVDQGRSMTMRKIVAGLFISLDGVTEAPNQWQFEFDEDMSEALASLTAAQDAILLGRVTYQDWAAYWPTADEDSFASFINTTPKYVVSTTLDTVEWQNSTLIKGDLAEAIGRLKEQPGKNIGVSGSPTLVRSLLQADLLDELELWVHPVIAGSGKRLFEGESELKRLKLVESKTTRSGVVILTYQPAQRA